MQPVAREHFFANIANVLVERQSFSINAFEFPNYD